MNLRLKLRNPAIVAALLVVGVWLAGCKKHDAGANTNSSLQTPNAAPQEVSTVPAPLPTPATPVSIAPPENGNVDATLAELTRELRKTMIRRRLSGSFEEFVAVRNLTVPAPPAGKKYAISKQWRVILVDAK
jgi:hypothetical protein